MDTTARADAATETQRIFSAYRMAQPADTALVAALTDGKLYELYVLSQVATDLAARGFTLRFVPSAAPSGAAAAGSTLKFKASPGMIKQTDSHFEVRCPDPGMADCYLFLNIEFDTLGHSQNAASDNSRRHELDIVLTWASSGYPTHDQIALGVECKAVANFEKGLVKEALGVRRELSYLQGVQDSLPSLLGGRPVKEVPASPPSEFIVAFIDPKGQNYAQSPKAFGIDFVHLRP